jgi:UDP-4-amino-4,6-dideoxy-N-acetyl-beta-L-altrosamine transaminase
MKYIPYARQDIDKTDIRVVTEALRSDYITQGPRVREFEEKIAVYCGAGYAAALNSGTSALHAACFAAGIGPGDEVITSAISFAASANCVLYCGGKPVFSDILEETVTADPEDVEKNITGRTRAVIPVDFAGHPAESEEIRRIAKKHNLIIIEDAAHALGAEYRKTRIGSCRYSDMTILSFHAVKHITTGEGGIVLTNNKQLYDRIAMFRTHGITRDANLLGREDAPRWYYEMQFLGFNYRITDLQCALGISQLKRLGYFLRRRREIAGQYKKAFGGIKGITCLAEKKYARSSWHIFPIRVKAEIRDRVFDQLTSRGIGCNLHYIPIYLHPYYKKLGYRKGICPRAEKYFNETITLPLFPKMSDSQVEMVIDMTIRSVKDL